MAKGNAILEADEEHLPLRILARKIRHASYSTLRRWISDGRVGLDGKLVKLDHVRVSGRGGRVESSREAVKRFLVATNAEVAE